MKQLSNARKSRPGETLTRWVKEPGRGTSGRAPVLASEGETGTMFPTRVVRPGGSKQANPLVSGHSNIKIGRDVRIGRFKGYWIYSLSLEERATCPTTCNHWRGCYGNNMPFAVRYSHHDQVRLWTTIEAQLARLVSVRHRRGILVRLHALGDFYSPEYVWFWRRMLDRFPTLAIWGYTARQYGDPIHAAIMLAKTAYGDRFRVRWSDGGGATDCTVSITEAADCPSDAFLCPEQQGRTKANGDPVICATCGACWASDKNVAFVGH